MTREEAIDAIKEIFIAKACKDGSAAAAVAAALFDNAKHALDPSTGLSHEALGESTVETHVRPNQAGLDVKAVSREIDRLGSRLSKFSAEKLPMFGITSIKGPTKKDRGDQVNALWLRIEYVPQKSDPGLLGLTFEADVQSAGGVQVVDELTQGIAEGKPRELYFGRGPRGKRFLAWSFILLLTIATVAIASPPGKRLLQRIVDAITSSSSLPEMLEKLRVNPDQGVFETPGGTQSQTARSASGSQVRLAPGPSSQYLGVESLITKADVAELAKYIVPLTDMSYTGIAAAQYRTKPEGAILPWVAEVLVIPEQDAAFTAEIEAQKAVVSLTYDPPVPVASMTRIMTKNEGGKRITVVSELIEFPRHAAKYAVQATVRRERQRTTTYRATIHINADGYAAIVRNAGIRLAATTEERRVGMPICTTILHEPALPLFTPGQTDLVWAQSRVNKEQKVIFTIYPPSEAAFSERATVVFGDGSRAEQPLIEALFLLDHHYRVGNRIYPITIYFDGSPIVYNFDLYVFADRPRSSVYVLDYHTPYPPNPDDASLAEMNACTPGEICIVIRGGHSVSLNPTFALQELPQAWVVPLNTPAINPHSVNYVIVPQTEVSLDHP